MNLTKDFHLKVKAVGDAGTFTGYAATYGNTDLVGDVIAPGAFTKAIQGQGAGYPLLWGHDQTQPLGVGQIADSTAGLTVSGRMVMGDPAARRAMAHLKAGSIKGLSIGFQVPDGKNKSEYQDDGTRLLKEIRLHEISLVACPANPLATITSVKSLQDVSRVLGSLDPAAVDKKSLLQLSATLRKLLAGTKDDLCECPCDSCVAGDCDSCSNPDCEDENCSGCADDDDPEELAALQQLAADLAGLRV